MLIDDGTGGLSKEVIGVAIEIHRKFGAGLLEDAYFQPMVWALEKRGFEIETEVPLAIEFEGHIVQRAYIIDVVVKRGEYRLLLEIKSVATILPIHIAQVTTYLSLSGIQVGLLMNFNVQVMRHGIKRVFHPDMRRHLRTAGVWPQATEGIRQDGEVDSGDRLVNRPSASFYSFE
jgi:GxxExxY protein